MSKGVFTSAEHLRLDQDRNREGDWKRWGPYLSERQWGTVREDYSPDGDAWRSFPFEHAPSRAYRWGEDGLHGWTDRKGRLCYAVSLWNGRDPILKERLFGLTGHQGNHGEDVKEEYFYLDATPTHSYGHALYKYPQQEFPYQRLIEENANRSLADREFKLWQADVFENNQYFDVEFVQAKRSPEDIYFVTRVTNQGPDSEVLHVLPTFWFRNTWRWGCTFDDCEMKSRLWEVSGDSIQLWHPSLGEFLAMVESDVSSLLQPVQALFTENETHYEKVFQTKSVAEVQKDGIQRYVTDGEHAAVRTGDNAYGTKMSWWLKVRLEPGQRVEIPVRLHGVHEDNGEAGLGDWSSIVADRKREADEFYAIELEDELTEEAREIKRQAFAGLLWTKQFYHYVIESWLEGDPATVAPPAGHKKIRNTEWRHLFARDVLSMPDSWEYPWFAAWDSAFHMIPMAEIDPEFAKAQLLLFLREWYLHPNGQMPAYEWEFSDVNPPVHAWALWRVYKIAGKKGERDLDFLERGFQKLMLNFNWWVNRKDQFGRNLFSGGFLGMDNIGVFDRSKGLPEGAVLEQADGTAWMAFFCGTMLSIALELAEQRPVYEDIASKFFEHYVSIADAMNQFGGGGLWDEQDGFYYDRLMIGNQEIPMRIKSLVGLMPLISVQVLDQARIDRLPGFKQRLEWFMQHRAELGDHISYCDTTGCEAGDKMLLAIPSRQRLEKLMTHMLNSDEFLSDFGIRSLSRHHQQDPFVLNLGGEEMAVHYVAGESDSWMFGGNSNWRGPIWFPINYLLIEALEAYYHYYGDKVQVELPAGSKNFVNLLQVADEIKKRLKAIFTPNGNHGVPATQRHPYLHADPQWEGIHLFHEYFDGDTGEGLGAAHQTGWTSLITRL
ncbi:MAG: glucosidase [Verrucomicrobiota bacterium]